MKGHILKRIIAGLGETEGDLALKQTRLLFIRLTGVRGEFCR